MTRAETTELLRLLPRYYGVWGTVRTLEAPHWHTHLAPFPPAVALEALRQWAHWHADSPPTPAELVGRCRFEAQRVEKGR